ncbi:phage tail protein [Salmonella enterica subsp. enterica serovar Rubislaw]|nr:phage tail protein [Salmonella enterica subsp. enterica serovar Rubislaw]
MFYVDNGSGIPNMPDIAEKRADTPQWFSEGKGNQQITWPGADFFNMWQAEGLNILAAAGIQPDKTKLNQLALAIKALIKQPTDDITDWAKKQFLAKDQNGADIPDKQKFIENLGLTETVKQAAGAVQKTGDAMTGKLTLPQTSAFGVNTDNALGGSSIAIGDNDTGIKQNADGVLDFYANGQLVARIQPGTLFVINAVQAGDGKKLELSSNNNSSLGAHFNLWGDGGDRPTVIELGDDKSWHLYSQRNADGSIQFCTVGQVVPGNYGNFDARYVQNVQRGAPVSPGKIDEYGPAEAPAGCVLTNARHDPATKYGVFTTYRPLQIYINGWRTIAG